MQMGRQPGDIRAVRPVAQHAVAVQPTFQEAGQALGCCSLACTPLGRKACGPVGMMRQETPVIERITRNRSARECETGSRLRGRGRLPAAGIPERGIDLIRTTVASLDVPRLM